MKENPAAAPKYKILLVVIIFLKFCDHLLLSAHLKLAYPEKIVTHARLWAAGAVVDRAGWLHLWHKLDADLNQCSRHGWPAPLFDVAVMLESSLIAFGRFGLGFGGLGKIAVIEQLSPHCQAMLPLGKESLR